MDNNKSRRDNGQIGQLVYSEKHRANRVVNVGETETSFSLSHKDGDSISAHSSAKVLAPGTHDCSDIQKFQAYADGLVIIYADANTSLEYNVSKGLTFEICAMSLKTDVTLVAR